MCNDLSYTTRKRHPSSSSHRNPPEQTMTPRPPDTFKPPDPLWRPINYNLPWARDTDSHSKQTLGGALMWPLSHMHVCSNQTQTWSHTCVGETSSKMFQWPLQKWRAFDVFLLMRTVWHFWPTAMRAHTWVTVHSSDRSGMWLYAGSQHTASSTFCSWSVLSDSCLHSCRDVDGAAWGRLCRPMKCLHSDCFHLKFRGIFEVIKGCISRMTDHLSALLNRSFW